MGNWHISIEGVGPHDNVDYPKDADRLGYKFVNELEEAGHNIKTATITSGSAKNLLTGQTI